MVCVCALYVLCFAGKVIFYILGAEIVVGVFCFATSGDFYMYKYTEKLRDGIAQVNKEK